MQCSLDTNFSLCRSTDVTATSLTISTSEGELQIPQSGNITLTGRDSKILVTDFIFGANDTTLLYATSE